MRSSFAAFARLLAKALCARQRGDGLADGGRLGALRLGLDGPPAPTADDVRQHQAQGEVGGIGDGEAHGAVPHQIDVVGERRAHLGALGRRCVSAPWSVSAAALACAEARCAAAVPCGR